MSTQIFIPIIMLMSQQNFWNAQLTPNISPWLQYSIPIVCIGIEIDGNYRNVQDIWLLEPLN